MGIRGLEFGGEENVYVCVFEKERIRVCRSGLKGGFLEGIYYWVSLTTW